MILDELARLVAAHMSGRAVYRVSRPEQEDLYLSPDEYAAELEAKRVDGARVRVLIAATGDGGRS